MEQQTGSKQDTSEQLEKPNRVFSQAYIERVYKAAGIPENFVKIKFEQIDMAGRAKPIWDKTLERAKSWNAGESNFKGILAAGSEGTGKSLALWANARAAVKSYVIANPPPNEVGTQSTPFYCKRFKNWMRFEFAPNERNPQRWNFELVHQMLDPKIKAIFFDDLTLDPAHEAFRPLKEFLEILVDDLTVIENAPKLYVTTNNTEDDWNKILGPQLVDRLIGQNYGICEPVRCVWESYR